MGTPPVHTSRRGSPASPPWTFLTHHGHVLLAVAEDPDMRVADLADLVGISPRAALSILKDLETAGYLRRIRVGRRTHYVIEPHRHFRHPAAAGHEIDELIALFTGHAPAPGGAPAAAPSDPGAVRPH
ncbi:ArsR family transcriptional regulator [Arthrobacter crusticola]|uniref:ArsR family transcriptional regulator n=1 Tax=Arthrobacter crusticola TaxID=2547960 RepID=A0A4R5TXD2_9MICC|nr:winged helix-turn-helix domain-containing protein [Arthrobacter crusticola]TDK25800.1 ArsR family transcriptional regulator [Arthrobacter crusticola]